MHVKSVHEVMNIVESYGVTFSSQKKCYHIYFFL